MASHKGAVLGRVEGKAKEAPIVGCCIAVQVGLEVTQRPWVSACACLLTLACLASAPATELYTPVPTPVTHDHRPYPWPARTPHLQD